MKRSWQILVFNPRPISFIKITGTHNTANEVFHCVHFEAPCDSEVLTRYLEHEQLTNLHTLVDKNSSNK